jgi:hypothetical protein
MRFKYILISILFAIILLVSYGVVLSRATDTATSTPIITIDEAANPELDYTNTARAMSQVSATTPITGMAWLKQWGSDQYDSPEGIVVDANGNVYLTGETLGNLGGSNAGEQDIWLAKYDSTGSQQWIQQWGTEQGDHLNGWGIAVDASGNIYVTGGTHGNLGGGNAGSDDVWLAKYDGTGTQLWIQQWGSDTSEGPYDIAVDSNGMVYITGQTLGDLGGLNAGDSDFWLAAYNSDGVQQWLRQWGTDDRDEFNLDGGRVLALDTSGNIFVAGQTAGDLGGTNTGGDDVWLAKYNGSGAQLWLKQWGEKYYDDLSNIAVDAFGNVYVSWNDNLSKFDSAGIRQCLRRWGFWAG